MASALALSMCVSNHLAGFLTPSFATPQRTRWFETRTGPRWRAAADALLTMRERCVRRDDDAV